MNNQFYYENTILHVLYKMESISTVILEEFLGNVDYQLVNNVVCNRTKTTSYIYKGFLSYDEANQLLSITDSGKKEIEKMYHGKRSS